MEKASLSYRPRVSGARKLINFIDEICDDATPPASIFSPQRHATECVTPYLMPTPKASVSSPLKYSPEAFWEGVFVPRGSSLKHIYRLVSPLSFLVRYATSCQVPFANVLEMSHKPAPLQRCSAQGAISARGRNDRSGVEL